MSDEMLDQNMTLDQLQLNMDVIVESQVDILPQLKRNFRQDRRSTIIFFCQNIVVGNEYIIQYSYELIDMRNPTRLIQQSIEDYWIYLVVYQLFLTDDPIVLDVVLDELFGDKATRKNHSYMAYLLRMANFMTTKFNISERLLENIDPLKQLLHVTDCFDVKYNALQLVASCELLRDMWWIIQNEYCLEGGSKKEKDAYHQLYKLLEEEMKYGFRAIKKQLNNSYNEIQCRQQLNRYQLIVDIFENDLNRYLQRDNTIFEFLGFSQSGQSRFQIAKDQQKLLQRAKQRSKRGK